MKNFKIIGAALVVLITVLNISWAQAQDLKRNISIENAYIKATIQGQTASSAFMKISNKGEADQLLTVTSDTLALIQIHQMSMQGNVMKMGEVKSLEIPQNGQVELTPGGYHLMLLDLKTPINAGDKIILKLKFARAGVVEVVFIAKPVGSPPMMQHQHMNM